ncbi:hypothetical protein HYV87_05120 [Candidatus Woesearchaeota archaeon]|nr:hypothetical protein [Candidatus Woesearchaeota archaeon]
MVNEKDPLEGLLSGPNDSILRAIQLYHEKGMIVYAAKLAERHGYFERAFEIYAGSGMTLCAAAVLERIGERYKTGEEQIN